MMCIAVALLNLVANFSQCNIPCVSIMMMVGRLMVMMLFFDITVNNPIASAATTTVAPNITTTINTSTILMLVLVPVQMMVLMLRIACVRIVALHFVHIVGDEWVAASVAAISNANVSEIVILIECL